MTEQEQKVKEFKEHLDLTVSDLLDNGYNEEFDIVIGINKKTIRLGLNADSYEMIKELLDNELE